MTPFLEKLASILEVDSIGPDSRLVDIETWDSVSALSVLALVDADYGITLTADALLRNATAGELEAYIHEQSGDSNR